MGFVLINSDISISKIKFNQLIRFNGNIIKNRPPIRATWDPSNVGRVKRAGSYNYCYISDSKSGSYKQISKVTMKTNEANELFIRRGRKPRKFCRVCAFNLVGEKEVLARHYEFYHEELKNPEWLQKD